MENKTNNKLTFFGKIPGISVEQLIRYGKFDMKVKHFHNQYEIFYIVEGERQFFFDNKSYNAFAGDIAIIDTNLVHTTRSIAADDTGYNRVILYIDYEKMCEYDNKYPELKLVEFFHQNYGVYHLDEDQRAFFLNLYRDLRHELTFEAAAALINRYNKIFNITGAIVQRDDGVLINNRLEKKIPIVDEVGMIDKVPLGMLCAVEVAPVGGVVEVLSNPYGIATLFKLSPEDTKQVVPIARALIGNRSAVVIKTPEGDVKERRIPAGSIEIIGAKKKVIVGVEEGAEKMMEAVNSVPVIEDIKGEPGTNAGGMLEKVRQVMSNLTNQHPKDIKIQDLLAVDTYNPQKIKGGLANEFSLESAVGIAAMVKADRLQMKMIAEELTDRLKIPVYVGGVEADMAIKGALTTPGTNVPLAIVDMGAGSTDASIKDRDGNVKLVHLAGAGNMVTLLIQSELGLEDFNTAEDIKKYSLAKVESLFHIRHEDGTVQFFEQPLDPNVFAKVVLVKEDGELVPLEGQDSMEKIKMVRTNAKKKVFVTNAIRSLAKVSPTGNVRDIEFVVLVGGSALDFEVPTLVTDALSQYNIVAGRGNIRGCEGPRNAVATGLAMSCADV